jgi:Tfp pilus assembly protein PilF
VAIMQKLLDDDADNVLALNFIGYLYANRGVKLDDAEKLLRRAMELRPDDGYVLDSWGWYLVQRGKLDDAREALEQADRLSPFEPEILLHLGELYVRRGEAERAREMFERALALDPDDRTRLRLEQGIRTVEARRD